METKSLSQNYFMMLYKITEQWRQFCTCALVGKNCRQIAQQQKNTFVFSHFCRTIITESLYTDWKASLTNILVKEWCVACSKKRGIFVVEDERNLQRCRWGWHLNVKGFDRINHRQTEEQETIDLYGGPSESNREFFSTWLPSINPLSYLTLIWLKNTEFTRSDSPPGWTYGITDERLIPVVFVPGLKGSNLYSKEGKKIWINKMQVITSQTFFLYVIYSISSMWFVTEIAPNM